MRISDWSSDVCSSDLRMPGQRHPLAVGFHVELLQVGREALEALVVGQHSVRAETPDVAVPHAEQAEDDRQVGGQRRRAEVLVHLMAAREELAEDRKSTRLNSSH